MNIIQGQPSHRRFKKVERDINPHPLHDRPPTLAEDLPSDVIKCTCIGHHLQKKPISPLPDTWNTQHQDSKSTERHIYREIQADTAIAVSDGSFKNSWGTVALITEVGKFSHPIISSTSTTSGKPEYQGEYRSKLSGIMHAIMIIDNICSKFNITEG